EVLRAIERGLVEPVRRSRVARFTKLKNRLRSWLRRQLDGPDEGMPGHAVAALLAGLRQRVEIEDDAERTWRAGDRKTRPIVAERAMALHVDLRPADTLEAIDLAPGHFPGAVGLLQLRQGGFQRANAGMILYVPLRDHFLDSVIPVGEQRHRN